MVPQLCEALRTAYVKRIVAAEALQLHAHANNGANLEQLGADARALAERVTAASSADAIEPEVTRLGDDYRVIWPARGVVMAFTGAHEGREGLRAEVSATLHGRALTPWGLAASRGFQAPVAEARRPGSARSTDSSPRDKSFVGYASIDC